MQSRPHSHREKHLNTLAALIYGLGGGRYARLSLCAYQMPSNTIKQERLIERFRRFLEDDRQTSDSWFLPLAEEALSTLGFSRFSS